MVHNSIVTCLADWGVRQAIGGGVARPREREKRDWLAEKIGFEALNAEPCTGLHGLGSDTGNKALIGILASARFYRRVLKANSHGGCSTAMENVARGTVAPLHPNFLAEFRQSCRPICRTAQRSAS